MSSPIPVDLARAIRLVILDVDGVLTDGGIYLGATPAGEQIEFKRFEIRDGLGIHLLREAGIEVAIVTGRESDAVRLRAEELGIEECHQDRGAEKLPIVRALLERKGMEWSETAFLADDLADLPVLRRVGLPAAVANAVPEVRAASRWFGKLRGGDGAAREFSEDLLKARGQWAGLVAAYEASRSEG